MAEQERQLLQQQLDARWGPNSGMHVVIAYDWWFDPTQIQWKDPKPSSMDAFEREIAPDKSVANKVERTCISAFRWPNLILKTLKRKKQGAVAEAVTEAAVAAATAAVEAEERQERAVATAVALPIFGQIPAAQRESLVRCHCQASEGPVLSRCVFIWSRTCLSFGNILSSARYGFGIVSSKGSRELTSICVGW